MDISQSILSDITIFNKYAKHIPALKRRENWDELCNRNMMMHIKKYPDLTSEIINVYRFVRQKMILPSMRSMQFGGRPIELANNRIYNCAYMAMSSYEAFSELMFLLLGGSGVGYSVQSHHIAQLPMVKGPAAKPRRFLVGDSIEGWADAIRVLVKAYFFGKSDPVFDFRDVRPKGARLITSGGKAPGPDPLRICVDNIRSVMNNSIGKTLSSLQIHDINCHIADAVLSGGIRRAALIALFDYDDYDMIGCKSGDWWELNPQRGRANNSAVLLRDEITEEQFKSIWELVELSNAGEPGIFWTNDKNIGTNPCCEISLNDCQFCNLTEVNVSDVVSQEDLNARVKAAAFIGTLQAGYTDFHYLRPEWKEMTEKEALIGVGMTGIGGGKVQALNLVEAAEVVKTENARVAKLIGINPAARNTTVKPSGCTTLDTEIKTSLGYNLSMKEIFESQGFDEQFLKGVAPNTWLELNPIKTTLPRILDENNDLQEIKGLYVNGSQEVFEIEFEDGNKYKLTGNHRLKTPNGWKRVDQLTENDEIISY